MEVIEQPVVFVCALNMLRVATHVKAWCLLKQEEDMTTLNIGLCYSV